MFELLTLILFVWLTAKAIGLAFKVTWGISKVLASVLLGLAFPLLIVFFMFIGGIVIIIPVILVAIALLVLSACVD